MRVTFIRHGQSTGNAGLPCDDLALIELTEKGWRQARQVSDAWTEPPSLVVTSPYLRTQQTAQPTIDRFPTVPVEVWPIQEFTYLRPSRWNGTLSAERQPHIEEYWQAHDPELCDGAGAESFATLLRRAEDAIRRLEGQPKGGKVLVFSHGQFIQAVRMIVLYPGATDREMMEYFRGTEGMPPLRNAELVELELRDESWRFGSSPNLVRS